MKKDRVRMPILPQAEAVIGEGQRQVIGETITWKDPRKVKFVSLSSKGMFLYALDDQSNLWYSQNSGNDSFYWQKVKSHEFES